MARINSIWIPITLSLILSSPFVDCLSANFAQALVRSRRAAQADKLSPLVEHMQRLARLTNGIALEIGMIDGTISSDSVISELLHMDTLKPKDITDLDPTIIDAALVELDKLHQEVKVSGEVTDIQKRLILLNDVRERAKTFMTAFFKLEGKGPYETALKGFATSLPMISQQVALLKKELVSLDGAVDTLNNYPVFTTETDASDALNRITGYFASFRQMQKLATSSEPVWTELQNLKSLKSKSEFMQLIKKEHALREELRSGKDPRPEDVNTLKNNFKKVFGARAGMKKSQAFFSTINKLVLSRVTRQDLILTGGLPNGRSDIESLNSDSSNPWIVERVDNSSVVTASLKKAFASFDEFTREFGNVEKKWKDMVTNQESVASILDFLSVLSTSDSDGTEMVTTVDSLITCYTSIPFPITDMSKMTPIQENVEKLNSLLDQVNDLKEIEELKDMTSVIGILQKHADQGDKIQIANSIVKKVKEDATYKKVSDIIVRLKKYLDGHDKLIEDITSTMTSITSSYNEISKHHLALTSSVYQGFFTCLDAVGDQGTHLKESMVLVQKVQVPDSTFTEAKTTIKSIVGSKTDLVHFWESAEKMKKVKAPEALGLKTSFVKSKDVSQKLSKAVQGLATIKKLQDARKTLDSFSKEVKNLENDKKPWPKDVEEKIQELAKIRDDLDKTLAGVDAFLKELQKVRRRRRSSAYRRKRSQKKKFEFKALGDVLKAAGKVPGVKLALDNLDKIKTTITNIQKTANKNFIFPGLDLLKELGKSLDLSTSGFDSSVTSLAAIDLFFTSYGTQMATVSTSNPQNPNDPNSPAQLAMAAESTTTEMPWYQNWVYWVIAGIGALLLAAIVALIVACTCCRKTKPAPVDPEIILPPCPPVGVEEDKPKEDKKPEVIEVVKEVEKKVVEVKEVEKEVVKEVEKVVVEENWEGKLEKTQMEDADVLLLVKEAVKGIRTFCSKLEPPVRWAERMLSILGYRTFDHDYQDTHKSERIRSCFDCIEQTAVQLTGFDNPFINANEMIIDGVLWIMSQGPTDGTEIETFDKEENKKRKKGEPKKEPIRKKNTMEKHWAMLDQRNIGLSAQLCQFVEDGKKKCAEYYSTNLNGEVKTGRYTIKTIRIEENLKEFTDKNAFKLYTLQYTNTQTPQAPPKTHQILAFSKWPDQDAPVDPTYGVEIVRYLDNSGKNVLVHCSVGVGRTGTIVAIKYGIKLCQEQAVRDVCDIIKPVRACRFGAVQCSEQIPYLILCITKAIMELRQIPYLREYDALYYYHESIQRSKYRNWKRDANDEWKKNYLEEDAKDLEESCDRKYNAYLAEKQKKDLEEEKKPKETSRKSKKSKVEGVKTKASEDAPKSKGKKSKESKASKEGAKKK